MPEPQQGSSPGGRGKYYCPGCDMVLAEGVKSCRFCGAVLSEEVWAKGPQLRVKDAGSGLFGLAAGAMPTAASGGDGRSPPPTPLPPPPALKAESKPIRTSELIPVTQPPPSPTRRLVGLGAAALVLTGLILWWMSGTDAPKASGPAGQSCVAKCEQAEIDAVKAAGSVQRDFFSGCMARCQRPSPPR